MKNLTRTIGLAGAATLFVASVMSSVAYNKPPESNDLRPQWEKPSAMPDTSIPSIYREDSPIRLKDPANITTETQYDHATGDYTTVKKVGEDIAKKCLAANIESVRFDRGGYVYHGRVQALADAAREAGLKF